MTAPHDSPEQQQQAAHEAAAFATHGVATAVQFRASRVAPQTFPGPPGTYGYRIGARLAPNDWLVVPGDNAAARAKSVVLGGVWEALSLTDNPLGTTSEFVLLGRGFPSREAAELHGVRVLDAMRVAGIAWRVGLDLGDSRPDGSTLPNGKGYVINLGDAKTDAGEPIPIVPHLGLHVFVDGPGIQFISGARPIDTRKVDIARFAGAVSRRVERLSPLSPRQRISCDLLHALRFESGPRARFVLAVAAVEALLDQPRRGGAAKELIDRAIDYATTVRCELEKRAGPDAPPRDELDALMNGLRGLRRQSITQSGKALAGELLPGRTYLGTSAPELFHRAYKARGGLVHTGDPGIPLEAFESLARLTELFARDLCLAHVGDRPEVQPASAR